MEVATMISAFFLNAFTWFSAATLALQIAVVAATFLVVAAFAGLIYQFTRQSKVAEPEPILEPEQDIKQARLAAYMKIPQNVKDAYFARGPVIDSEQEQEEAVSPPKVAPKTHRFKGNQLYYNKEDQHYYHDQKYEHIYYKAAQSEIDQENGILLLDGMLEFAKQYKNKP